MVRRHIHYEAAFEDYLRSRGLPYIAVDEAKRAVFAGSPVKSFDFLVYRPNGPIGIVDIKGRKFPYDTVGNHRYWENWVTEEDLQGLSEWGLVFGKGFQPILVFAYWMTVSVQKWSFNGMHLFRGEYYAFLAMPVSQYKALCVKRSPKWETVTVPAKEFRSNVTLF